VLARASLARSMWLEGYLDQANVLAKACLVDASSHGDILTSCFVLGMAVGPVAIMRGELVSAERAADMLLDVAIRHSFTQYTNVGRSLKAELLIERDDFATAANELRAAFRTREETGWSIGYPEFASALARCLAGLGHFEEAIAMLKRGLARAEAGDERWYVPELLRILGKVWLQLDPNGFTTNAEDCFVEAISMARNQGALFWELRASADLARMILRRRQDQEAYRILSGAYERFTEGFETADLRAAAQILSAAGSLQE
jgi:tetratricopeptide (TPR) repeat protein